MKEKSVSSPMIGGNDPLGGFFMQDARQGFQLEAVTGSLSLRCEGSIAP